MRLEVDVGVGRDLAEDEHEAGRRGGLAGDPGVRVLADDRVQDGVADLVAHLVRVALGDGLGREQVLRGVDDAHGGGLPRSRGRPRSGTTDRPASGPGAERLEVEVPLDPAERLVVDHALVAQVG